MRHQFVRSSVNAVFQDTWLHDAWWQVDTLVDEINTRYQLGEDTKVKKAELLCIVGKEYHEKSIEGNTFVCESSSDVQRLKLFQHDFKAREGGKQIKYDSFRSLQWKCPKPTQLLHPILLRGKSKMLPNRYH